MMNICFTKRGKTLAIILAALALFHFQTVSASYKYNVNDARRTLCTNTLKYYMEKYGDAGFCNNLSPRTNYWKECDALLKHLDEIWKQKRLKETQRFAIGDWVKAKANSGMFKAGDIGKVTALGFSGEWRRTVKYKIHWTHPQGKLNETVKDCLKEDIIKTIETKVSPEDHWYKLEKIVGEDTLREFNNGYDVLLPVFDSVSKTYWQNCPARYVDDFKSCMENASIKVFYKMQDDRNKYWQECDALVKHLDEIWYRDELDDCQKFAIGDWVEATKGSARMLGRSTRFKTGDIGYVIDLKFDGERKRTVKYVIQWIHQNGEKTIKSRKKSQNKVSPKRHWFKLKKIEDAVRISQFVKVYNDLRQAWTEQENKAQSGRRRLLTRLQCEIKKAKRNA